MHRQTLACIPYISRDVWLLSGRAALIFRYLYCPSSPLGQATADLLISFP